MVPDHTLSGVGLGWRREHTQDLLSHPSCVDFLEIAPENWIRVGGRRSRDLRSLTERYPFVTHGLSLSLGGLQPIDTALVIDIKNFLKQNQITIYSEHLSYCSDEGHLYDLLPIPFTSEAVDYVAQRIRQVQAILERPIAIENASYYVAPGQELSEIEFINAVMAEAQCHLLLDVNNVYVNSVNHGYDPLAFLQALKPLHIDYYHVAGHYQEASDLIIDTHGSDVIDPVWTLLEQTYQLFGPKPTLLERDFNIPPFKQIKTELQYIRTLQQKQEQLSYAVG